MDYPDISHLLARSKQITDDLAAAARVKKELEPAALVDDASNGDRNGITDLHGGDVDDGDEDENFSDEEIEKMILEMKDKPLPDRKDSAIVINQTYRDLLKEMMKKLDAFEIRLEEKKTHIEELLVRSKSIVDRHKPGFSKVRALQYIPPYFRDASALCPPSNEDAIHRIQNTPNFDILRDVPRPFSKKEGEELKMAVTKILNDRLLKLKSRKRKNAAVNDLLRGEIDENDRRITKSRVPRKISSSDELTSSDWSGIATMSHRTAYQCAEKYQSELNENLINKQWTAEEDARLIDAVEVYQQGDYIPWKTVAHLMEGKLRSQCQSRWERALNPALRRGRWTEEEDKRLLDAVHQFGTGDWSKIADQMSDRSVNQCRERYCTVLDAGIKMSGWTAKEDAVLLVGIETFGLGSWSKIRLLLPGRTAAMCKNRHISLKRRILRDLSKKRAMEALIEKKRRIRAEKEAKRMERLMAKKQNREIRSRFRKKKKMNLDEDNQGDMEYNLEMGINEDEPLAAYLQPQEVAEKAMNNRKRGRPRKLPGEESCADRKRRLISDLLKESMASAVNRGDSTPPNFVTLTITREQLIMNSGKENFRLQKHIERKIRVTQWCLDEHGRLPASGLISQDVNDFIDSQPDEVRHILREKMERIYSDQDIAVHRIPLNLKNMVL